MSPRAFDAPLSRRGLLRAGGGLGLAALGLGHGAAAASAAVPASARFDLTQPSYDLFRGKPLHDDTVQQSFAFDQVNKRLFVAQLRNGSGQDELGNLCVTQLDFAGNQVSYMHLSGFGHGVAFGVEPSGTDSYLWTEVDANTGGFGTRLARFKFVKGGSLSNTSTAIRKFAPIAGATEYTCSIDPVHNTLVTRYHKDGAKHIAVYDLAAASAGTFGTPKVNFPQPALPTKSPKFQGYTAYGQYLYCLTGTDYVTNGNVVDSEITSIDLNTGKIKEGPVLTKAGESLSFREAEGMAVYRTDSGEARLFLGFASGDPGDRRSNIFYKNALV
ncbi:teichoic acid biosynthesis protein C [Streptomyces sp. NPDC001922]|uniref:phage baseplate protein n=1 Tax=Streptomyces sp. NPDC001922 TaxID=3364624 RepID=UPI00368F81C3